MDHADSLPSPSEAVPPAPTVHPEYYHHAHSAYSLPPEARYDEGHAPPLTRSSISSFGAIPSAIQPSPQTGYSAWSPGLSPRPRGNSVGGAGQLILYDNTMDPALAASTGAGVSTIDRADMRPQRPSGPARTPSNTYAPQRTPTFLSAKRPPRRDPNAQYKAQEKAYVQRVRQGPSEWFHLDHPQMPAFGFADSEPEDESPGIDTAYESDPYDADVHAVLEDANLPPTIEDLHDPKNRERLEWHSMLEAVLKGDVIKQEKQRLIGIMEQKNLDVIRSEMWVGVKARTCGRPVALQHRMIEHQRASVPALIDTVVSFQIKGESETGKSPTRQVEEVVDVIAKIESLYPSIKALREHHSRASTESYITSCDAVISWHNTTTLINTELSTLKRWVGNDELDFMKPLRLPGSDYSDEGSFLDRIMKEDGLRTLENIEHHMNLLNAVSQVVQRAKSTLIQNSEAFAERHLPPYIEELLTLINFPSRLVQEIIRLRVGYARKMKDPGQQTSMLVDQMISQFQVLLRVAVHIKQRYLIIAHPEPGWEPPPCVDENFDAVVVDALKHYFKLLNWKLSANKNTFKEAEILEQEWEFCNEIGRQLENGDIEVAEQFSTLTAKSLQRLMLYFEKELVQRPFGELPDMEERYKQILDSVRVRQRKLFRFSRLLRHRFENATEFNLAEDMVDYLLDALLCSGHFLVLPTDETSQKGIFLIASPSLYGRPRDIQSILGTSSRAEDAPEDPTDPYILVLRSDKQLVWTGRTVVLPLLEHPIDVRMGRLRLVADGSQQRLSNAKLALMHYSGLYLDVTVEQRANLSRVNAELNKIKKTAYKLSATIMQSVEVMRKQSSGTTVYNELVQSFYAFATEFSKRSLMYMDPSRRSLNYNKLIKLGLDWVSFVCDDCDASDRKTFKWAVQALEFAMVITHGQSILTLDEEDYNTFRIKVAGCMSVLISHFDIMGARSNLAAEAEKMADAPSSALRKLDLSRIPSDEAAAEDVTQRRLDSLAAVDDGRIEQDARRQALGKVLDGVNEADPSIMVLSSSATNITLRWQQGQYLGGGTSGSVFAAIDLDTSYLMAVKEIRLQEPAVNPNVAQMIRDEMSVLEVLDHPNIVSYHGIEVHRDKVYIFMEYCSGGSLAELLEHGRIEDETVVMVYALQMLEGLAYLHSAGVVHRDIKPANVLLDHNGVIKYVDFGAAMVIARQSKTLAMHENDRLKDPRRGHHGSVTGTPMYMSPELVRGELGASPGRRGSIDIWSLGCVILEMVTGLRPWASLDNEWAIMYKIAQGNRPHLPTPDQLSPEGIDFIRCCFDIDQTKRPSAVELLQHEWIVNIRRQVVAEPQTPSTEGGSGGMSMPPSAYMSRQPSSYM